MRSSDHNFTCIFIVNVNTIANKDVIECFYAPIVVSKTYDYQIDITSPRLRLYIYHLIEIFTVIDEMTTYRG